MLTHFYSQTLISVWLKYDAIDMKKYSVISTDKHLEYYIKYTFHTDNY